ncbi:NAD(P)-binding protein [Schizophyllum commune H4-8]|uniref:NmrA-like domain-containing protein n=1 Tax=Schizophyllum commune (strain H4-8 / FGSC 9210) TaxID=578458 RepID=D8Q2Y1_SCHCM|nr:NAD(P)-binding protein [Schizophyllum commune H4-8]KAI5894657.1 NAD(P)-binding protein [Schizophyllum commune H4-8]
MSSSFKSFAVAGANSAIGKATVEALAKVPAASTLVLTRQSTPRPAWLPAHVAHAGIDYADIAGTAAVLRAHNVEVVIAPVGHFAVPQQVPLASAAKQAGVQLFVPSEFGTPTKGWRKGEAPPYLLPKIEVADHLESIGLPSLRIFPGCFAEFIAILVGYNANKKVNILNSLTGEKPFSVTTNPDIGAFVAHLVTHYPLSALANKAFRIEGDRITLKSLAAIFDAPIERVDVIPVAPEIPLPSEFVEELQRVTERGLLSIDTVIGEGDGAGGANDLWEGHHWTTVKEYLKGDSK